MPSQKNCAVCGAEDPRWVRHIDGDVGDMLHRIVTGFPGRSSHAVRYCDTPECAAAIEAQYGPTGNRAAFHRLTDELGQKGLDADDNEVRLAAVVAQRLGL